MIIRRYNKVKKIYKEDQFIGAIWGIAPINWSSLYLLGGYKKI